MVRAPKVAIILLNWNNYNLTEECLESLKVMLHRNFKYEIIVVDNGSPQWEVESLRGREDISYLIENDTNLGYVIASNKAIRYALSKDFDYILQLDNDAVVDKYCIEELIKTAEEDKEVGIVGGKIFYYNQPERLQWAGEKVSLWTGDVIGLSRGITRIIGKKEFGDDTYNEVREVDVIVSWCSLSKREVWEKVGLLDEYLFFGWEDDDFCMRAKKIGYKMMYTPYAKLWHRYSSAFALDGLLQYHGPRTRFRFMRKHATRLQLTFFYSFFFGIHFWLATAYYLLWVRRPKVWLKFLRGVWDGFRGKEGILV